MTNSAENDAALCNAEHEESGARCLVIAGEHGPMHQGWAHFPGSLAVWPYVTTPAETGGAS